MTSKKYWHFNEGQLRKILVFLFLQSNLSRYFVNPGDTLIAFHVYSINGFLAPGFLVEEDPGNRK